MGNWKLKLVVLAFLCTGGAGFAQENAVEASANPDSLSRSSIEQKAGELFNGLWFKEATGYNKRDSTILDTILIDHRKKRVRVEADRMVIYAPLRPEIVDSIYAAFRAVLDPALSGYSMEVLSSGKPLPVYIPNFYREATALDRSRQQRASRKTSPPLVRNTDRAYLEESVLFNSYIALWHSHGWYYESKLDRWEWQRARLFQTVEDLYPMAYTLKFLVPMLENAGAQVLMPRERDIQLNEVIVDNDGSTGNSVYVSALLEGLDSAGTGFGLKAKLDADENPFRLGSFESMKATPENRSSMQWIPEIPESGDYAVYVSYGKHERNVDDALYRVYHAGGSSTFRVNQRMGAGTWIYLGHFHFRAGLDPAAARVELINESGYRRGVLTGDAVRFGGGMGNIARQGKTSLRPRYQEAARYYLQYAGFPDSVVWKLNEPGEDYKDDYQSRGEWVSYLMAPSSPKSAQGSTGLGIPVDLSFAFHTDAGITDNDTVVGTLGIFSTTYKKGPYPTGISRMSSRDFCDLVQTQIVEDLRELYDPAWTRRPLWDKAYSEAFRPDVPSMLLELLSHQNFLDMRFGQDPMFRFHTSRAIYKGMLKFLSSLKGTDYIVQPLPVSHMKSSLLPDGKIGLSWRPLADPLEATADPEKYRVYIRVNEGGFDRGREVSEAEFVLEDAHPDSIYSFRVTALNRGGESFPSEIVSACHVSAAVGKAAVITAFDRVAGPAVLEDSLHAGFVDIHDEGVAWGTDLHSVGSQFDFRKDSPWLDDDAPGHGASFADMEDRLIAGNTFDFGMIHGRALRSAGYSFACVSDEVFEEDSLDLGNFDLMDYLAGEERSTYLPKNDTVGKYAVFPGSTLTIMDRYLKAGGALLLSGAHLASDMHARGQDSLVASVLKFRLRSDNASRRGGFYASQDAFGDYETTMHFNSGQCAELYRVESPDALEPARDGARTVLRYRENNMSAAVAWRGRGAVLSLGFPLESMPLEEERNELMQSIIDFLCFEEKDEDDYLLPPF